MLILRDPVDVVYTHLNSTLGNPVDIMRNQDIMAENEPFEIPQQVKDFEDDLLDIHSSQTFKDEADHLSKMV